MVPIRKCLSLLALVCLINYLGQCPCGCPDHSYWLQLAGCADDHRHASYDPSRLAQLAERHCEGGQREALWAGDARHHKPPRAPMPFFSFSGTSAWSSGVEQLLLGQRPERSTMRGTRQARILYQVFLL